MVFQNDGTQPAPGSLSTSQDHDAIGVRERLLQKIRAEADLPALGSSISRVVQMTSSDDDAVRDLARFILSDAALTQKVLRVANTVSYRTAFGTPITTVSKAIFLLGFDMVKTAALAMLLVDRMPGRHARAVRKELGHALRASVIGREMARRSQYKDAEEAAIVALFKNIGRLLVAAHEPVAYARLVQMVEAGTHSVAQASAQLLGVSVDSLGEAILRSWNIPERIVSAIAAPAGAVLRPARARQEWLQQIAAFSTSAAVLDPRSRSPGQEAAMSAVLARFGDALHLDQARLVQMIADVEQETTALASDADLSLYSDDQPENVPAVPNTESEDTALPGELLLHGPQPSTSLHMTQRHASGKPINSRELLLAGVQDVTQMMASGSCKLNDLMLLVLETLYSGMGFRFATVCLKDLQSQQYRARITIGEDNVARQSGFVFPIASARTLFHLALENDADVIVSDAAAPKIRALLPAWHRALLPDARSIIVLPLIVQGKRLGMFYADRAQPAPEGVPADEAALIKTLKGQLLAALQAR